MKINLPEGFLFKSWFTRNPKFLVGKKRPVVSETRPDCSIDFLSYDLNDEEFNDEKEIHLW